MHEPTPSPAFSLSELHAVLVVQLPPRLTVIEAIAFRRDFAGWLDARPGVREVVLDFGRTFVLDSSGLGALISNLKTARTRNLPLQVWSVSPQVRLALSLAGLEAVVPFTAHTEAILPLQSRRSEKRPPLTHPSVRSPLKRAIDILGALAGLAITSVLFVPIALAIRMNSRGPILFSQVRCGWMGRHFRIWKFRSMVPNAEALKTSISNQAEGAFFKNENDPRITPVGRFLRKTSLDELPQFWNVLMGDMSLIGTRPSTPDEVEQYDVPNWQRFDVKPGLSGEWQVNGRSSIKRFEDVINLDLRYQKNWSISYDLKLILKTLLVVFSKKGGAV
jgi:anti-anti-sigma factor